MDQASIAPVLDPANWVDAYGDCLYRFALTRVRQPDTAEELVQLTLLAALTARHSFSGKSSERTWLFAIHKRKVADWLRKAVRRRVREEPQRDKGSDAFFSQNGSWNRSTNEWSSDDPGSEMNRVEFGQVLTRCLDKLPVRLRQVFVLRYVTEESMERIRRSADVTSANLSVMLHRARMRLWRCLNVNWFGDVAIAFSMRS